MRSRLTMRLEAEQSETIDLSPLLDVVFILLIFFIVTTVFVKETGIEVDTPTAMASEELDRKALVFAISAQGDVVYDGASIGIAGIASNVKASLQKGISIVIVQADKATPAERLVAVIDAAKLAGASSVKIATERF